MRQAFQIKQKLRIEDNKENIFFILPCD